MVRKETKKSQWQVIMVCVCVYVRCYSGFGRMWRPSK